jgi:general secretion pathway protein G
MNRHDVLPLSRGTQERPDSGWTFVESIIVITIVLILTGTVAFTATRYVDRARMASAQSQIAELELALQAYYLDTGSYPTAGQGLDALWSRPTLSPVPPQWDGPYVDGRITADPWGNRYEYRVPGVGGLPFEIVSYGADGLAGGTGSDADISSSGE